MEYSTLLSNTYDPYASYNSDINNIIEQERNINEQNNTEFNKSKKIMPLTDNNSIDFDYIFENITYVFDKSFDDIFNRHTYKTLIKQDRWIGLGYIFICIYLIHYLSKF